MMLRPIDVEVRCREGYLGRSTELVLDPLTKNITHVVVYEGHAPYTERLVPIQLIKETTADMIFLHFGKRTFDHLKPLASA